MEATRQKTLPQRTRLQPREAAVLTKEIVAIIPAAGKPTNHIVPNNNQPDTMLPINGKPVIAHIIDDLLERKVTRVSLILNKHDTCTEQYVKRMYATKCNVRILYNKSPERGVGYSIALAVMQTPRASSFLVYLGDTIYKGKLSFDKDFVVTSKTHADSSKWCFVEEHGLKLTFIDKPRHYHGSGSILCGVYFFQDGMSLKKSLTSLSAEKDKLELADILRSYSHIHTTTLIPAEHWFDCGNIENYYQAKIHFLKVRKFNSISYNDTYGYITKRSADKKKILDEIRWYENTPPELSIFSPRLVSSRIEKKAASYAIEFYGYQSLADMFLFESLDIKAWQTIIKKLFTTLSLFKKYKCPIPFRHYEEMYYKKTLSRLAELGKKPFWKELLRKETLTINGTAYKNVGHFIPDLKKMLKKLYRKNEMTFMHGDFCLGNILYDPSSKILKCIDPRGSFGKTSVYGDLKYDVAKLRHSFRGYYDFIVSDLFSLEEKEGAWKLEFFTNADTERIAEYFDKELEKNGFDLSLVSLVEALLFLSMVPLHADNQKRQLAMYLRGIQLINSLSNS